MEVWVRQFHIGGDNKAKRSFQNPFFHSALWKLDCNKKPEPWFETDGTGLQMEYGQILRRRNSGTFWGKELARHSCDCWKEKEHFHFWQSSWDIPSQRLRTLSLTELHLLLKNISQLFISAISWKNTIEDTIGSTLIFTVDPNRAKN